MSISCLFYKEVTRNYIQKLFDKLDDQNPDTDTNSLHIKEICSELLKQGYDSFNKHVEWWRINYNPDGITVTPIHDC